MSALPPKADGRDVSFVPEAEVGLSMRATTANPFMPKFWATFGLGHESGPSILLCVKEHFTALSEQCKEAIGHAAERRVRAH